MAHKCNVLRNEWFLNAFVVHETNLLSIIAILHLFCVSVYFTVTYIHA